MCDKSNEAIKCITKNIQKTHFDDKVKIIKEECFKALDLLKEEKFDIIFIDPPYEADIAVKSVLKIIDLKLLSENGIIVIETDDKERELKSLKDININVYDLRRYGRVNLLFLNRKG